jgi:hypothetical protein
MRIRKWMRVAAIASLVGAGAATPAWAHGDRVTLQNGDSAATLQNGETTTLQNSDTVTTIQNGDAVAIRNWDAAAARNGGLIREDDFLDEMGRRWDADPNHTGMRSIYLEELRARWEGMDPANQGLTPAQVSELTGNVDSSALPSESGTGVQPGNMGPGNMKGQ